VTAPAPSPRGADPVLRWGLWPLGAGLVVWVGGALAGLPPQVDPMADALGGEVDVAADPAADARALLRKGPWVQDVRPDGATILWETDLPARSVVAFAPAAAPAPAAAGAPGAPLPAERRATGRTYVVRYLMPLQDLDPEGAYVHAVRLSGLRPGTVYTYRVESAGTAPFGAGGTFRTAPAGPADFEAVLFGDNRGAAARFASVVAAARAARPELVVATGDLVGEGSSDADWQTFFDVAGALLRDVPFYTTLGNHDVYKYGLPRFEAYFAAPPPAVPYAVRRAFTADACCVYAFDWGGAHFVMLDSNPGAGTADLQAEWLARDLAAARARGAAPILAFMHHPMFTLADHEPALVLRAKWFPILRDGGVAAVVAGHNHVYERFVVGGLQVITSGGAGAPTYEVNAAPERAEAVWRKAASERLHVIRLHVRAAGTAAAEVVDAETGAVIDAFTLGR
jgi:hypothetical protein